MTSSVPVASMWFVLFVVHLMTLLPLLVFWTSTQFCVNQPWAFKSAHCSFVYRAVLVGWSLCTIVCVCWIYNVQIIIYRRDLIGGKCLWCHSNYLWCYFDILRFWSLDMLDDWVYKSFCSMFFEEYFLYGFK